MRYEITNADLSDAPAIADLWYAGWHDAHAALVPQELTDQRTLESFHIRSKTHVPATRVVRMSGQVAGFVMVHENELFQLYVAPQGRGRGMAADLMADAEMAMAAQGHATAWLVCAIGNARAARFYEKAGWINKGERLDTLETLNGPYELLMWRMEKDLARG